MAKPPLGLRFEETMQGFLTPGINEYHQGFQKGEQSRLQCTLQARITIEDIDAFVNLTHRTGLLEGTLDYVPLGRNLKIEHGTYQLFTVPTTGERQLVCRFRFGAGGNLYQFSGHKKIVDDPWRLDLVEDMTRLFSRIERVNNGALEPFAAGIIRFDPLDAPALLRSMHALNAAGRVEDIRARVRFLSFVHRELRNEYLQNNSFLYWTGYENLVLNGRCAGGSESSSKFFFFSGAHDLGFPWGDGATFWDVVLVVDHPDGSRDRYLAADITLEGLRLDVERGYYRYEGVLYRLARGYQVSFLDDIRREDPVLEKTWGRIELQFKAHPFNPQQVLFPFKERYETGASDHLQRLVKKWLPHLNSLGIKMRPHRVSLLSGSFTIGQEGRAGTWIPEPATALGEAEITEFCMLKEPTIQYRYRCGINAEERRVHVQIKAGVWRNDRHLPLKDKIDRLLARMVNIKASREWLITDAGFQSGPFGSEPELQVTDPHVLEVNYDHYPTAVFQRRVIEMTDRTGRRFLALEENMDHLNGAALNSTARCRVVSRSGIAHPGNPDEEHRDKLALLDRVVAETGFLECLERRFLDSGKSQGDFLVAIKPNFMFLHNRRDISTYTDPALVERLVDHIRTRGFTNIIVVEARNTYCEFFYNRDPVSVARYLGMESGPRYRVVDLSLNLVDHDYGPPLHRAPVNREWRDADFRISFAKNKTHAYAFYTLNLKNIFGALPHQNKFREYHAKGDIGIYRSTIEYLAHFPIHFGFIDAYYSADGPFGVFADQTPVPTGTILGSPDIVALDWVSAARMGLNPLISEYMQRAVERFGKPRIDLEGDREIYEPWTNVPLAMTWSTSTIDRHYRFGMIFYAVFAEQDPAAFPPRSREWHIRVLRVLTKPIRDKIFARGMLDEEEMRPIRELIDELGAYHPPGQSQNS